MRLSLTLIEPHLSMFPIFFCQLNQWNLLIPPGSACLAGPLFRVALRGHRGIEFGGARRRHGSSLEFGSPKIRWLNEYSSWISPLKNVLLVSIYVSMYIWYTYVNTWIWFWDRNHMFLSQALEHVTLGAMRNRPTSLVQLVPPPYCKYKGSSPSGWWFGTFCIFLCIGNNHPSWLICFRGVETTNQPFTIVVHYPQICPL